MEVARITLFTERQFHNSRLDDWNLEVQKSQSAAHAGQTRAVQFLEQNEQALEVYKRRIAFLIVLLERGVAQHGNELERLKLEKRKDESTEKLERSARKKEILENEILGVGR